MRGKHGQAGTPGLDTKESVGIGTGGLELDLSVVAFSASKNEPLHLGPVRP